MRSNGVDRGGRSVGFAVALLALPLHADPARAPTKVECAKANADAQGLRMDGKFAAARAELETCGIPACPGMVRDDCAQRLDELDRAQPTLVFAVKDATGADVPIVAVSVDGRPLSGRLAGALRVDPGEHAFTISLAGLAPVTRRLVVKEAEKDRREVIVLPPVSSEEPPSGGAAPGLGTRKIVALATAGGGVAAAVVGGVFGAMTLSAVSQQKVDCASASDCPQRAQALSDHSTVDTDGAISTALFVAAGVLLAGGGVLFFTAPSPSSPAGEPTLSIAPTANQRGGGVSFSCRF